MVRLPSRKALEAMKRTDIQKLCKDYGVKANLKTEALIDLLQSINTPQLTREPPQPQARKVSTRRSSRAGPSRTGSIVIHDLEDEEEEEEEGSQEQDEVPPIPNPPPSRTRKAKETQLRLGVGRPKAAGGSGARAVTKSVSVSKGKRAKSSKTMKPSEAPIPEEVEEQDPPELKHSSLALELATASPESTSNPRSPTTAKLPADSVVLAEASAGGETAVTSQFDLENCIANAVRPLREQLTALHDEVERLKRDQQQVHVLQVTLDILTTELDDLRGQTAEALSIANELRQALKTPSIPRTPSPRSPRQEVPPAPHSISATTFAAIAGPSSKKGEPPCDPPSPTSRAAERGRLQHPGFALTTLGKRHRDSTTSNITGIIEEGEDEDIPEDELGRKVIRPMKKRLKTTRDSSTPSNATAGPSRLRDSPRTPTNKDDERQIPTFSVYRDPDPSDYIDPPPPTNHLPDFFEVAIAGSSRQTSASSEATTENQHPFSFSFLPYTSTPAHPSLVPPLPYPEIGQSPTPAGLSRLGLGRPSTFQPFGRSPRTDADEHQDGGAFVNPAALSTDSHRESSSSAGTPSAQTPGSSRTPQEPHPKPVTMYGTELEGDTRFGDFGVEGVASSGQMLPNFWTGGKF